MTRRPQPGNPPPNLFRLVEDRALVNRMGFPNDGVEATVRRLEKRRYRGICGVNIGKNFDTPLELAARDYIACLRARVCDGRLRHDQHLIAQHAGLAGPAEASSLDKLLGELAEARETLSGVHGKRVPLLVKIAPDLDDAGVHSICGVLQRSGVDGVVATNTDDYSPGIATLAPGERVRRAKRCAAPQSQRRRDPTDAR